MTKPFTFLLLVLLAFGARAATNTAAGTSLAQVQAAVNLSANGDTVLIPAGSSSWTGTLTITNDIQIFGAGTNLTFITDGGSGTATELFSWTTVSNGICRLNGITFTGVGVATNWTEDAFYIIGINHAFRVDHCVFSNFDGNAVIALDNQIFGVIDHCPFIQTISTSCNQVQPDKPSTIDPWGDLAWSSPDAYGTTNQIVVEDCSFLGPTNSLMYANDMSYGSSATFRHSPFSNAVLQAHGTEGGHRERGGRSLEIYDDLFTGYGQYFVNNGNIRFMSSLRSGTAVVFGNSMFNVGAGSYGFDAPNYRAVSGFPGFWYGNGFSGWDTNGGLMATGIVTGVSGSGAYGYSTMTDSGASWTSSQFVGGTGTNTDCAYELNDLTYEATTNYQNGNIMGAGNYGFHGLITANTGTGLTSQSDQNGGYIKWTVGDAYAIYKVKHELDQPGMGQGDLLAGDENGPYDTVTGKTNWPSELSDPVYFWGNTNISSSAAWTMTQPSYNIVILGRDVINGVKPGYTPLVYPHPLVTAEDNPQTNALAASNVNNLNVYGSFIQH